MSQHPYPEDLPRSPQVVDAYQFALAAHEGSRSLSDTGVAHPLAVARLLNQAGCSEHVVAAALLHDVIEDSTFDKCDITRRFGPRLAYLVDELSENPDILGFAERKADLRHQVRNAGWTAATIFVADKLANARELSDQNGPIPADKLEHYQHTLTELTAAFQDLPFAGEAQQLVNHLADPRHRR